MNRRYSLIAFIVILGMLVSPSGALAQEEGPTSPEATLADTGTWITTGSLTTARYGHTATLLSDGRVLVVGGYGGSGSYLASAEIYNLATGTWDTASPLTTARANHTATMLLDGKVLIAGGWNGITYQDSTEIYDPAAKTWITTGSLTTARYGHTATLLSDGRVLSCGW